MRSNSTKNLFLGWSLIGIGIVGAGCSGGGGGGTPGGGGGGGGGATFDITGTWSMTDIINATGCGEGFENDNYTLDVQQSGTSLTVYSDNGTFYGSVDGATIRWTGSYYDWEDEGTVTITDMNVVASSNGDHVEGTAWWTYSGDDGSYCSGSTAVNGDRTSGGGGSGGGSTPQDISGYYSATEKISGNCGSPYTCEYDLEITQNGQEISVITSFGTFSGTFDGSVASWSGAYYDTVYDGTAYFSDMSLDVNVQGSGLVEMSGNFYWELYPDNGGYCDGHTEMSLQEYNKSKSTNDEGPNDLRAKARDEAPEADLFYLEGYDPELPERRIRLDSAGPDEVAGTEDDSIAEYLEFRYDGFGGVIEARQFVDSGEDGLWLTPDDLIHGFFLYYRDADGALIRLEHFGDAGADGIWLSADDVPTSYVELMRGAEGELLEAISFGSAGDDDRWMTADDEPSVSLERVAEGSPLRRIAAGPDGVWFTADDLLR